MTVHDNDINIEIYITNNQEQDKREENRIGYDTIGEREDLEMISFDWNNNNQNTLRESETKIIMIQIKENHFKIRQTIVINNNCNKD